VIHHCALAPLFPWWGYAARTLRAGPALERLSASLDPVFEPRLSSSGEMDMSGDVAPSSTYGAGGNPSGAAQAMAHYADDLSPAGSIPAAYSAEVVPAFAAAAAPPATAAAFDPDYGMPLAASAPAESAGAASAGPPVPSQPLGETHPSPANVEHIGKTYRRNGQTVKGLAHQAYAEETRSAAWRGITPEHATGLQNRHLRPGESESRISHVFTHYLTPDEQKKATLGTGRDYTPGVTRGDGSSKADEGVARLTRGDGRVADTRGASGIGTLHGAGKDRDIYAMGEGGDVRALDPFASRHLIDDPNRPSAPGAPSTKQLGFINHSSLFEGGTVAGAGEMEIHDGRVKTISNSSGHYMPGAGMLHQATSQMANRNVLDLAKPDAADRSRVDIHGGGSDGNVNIDALKFLAASHGQADIAAEAFGPGHAHKTQHASFRKDEAVNLLAQGRETGARADDQERSALQDRLRPVDRTRNREIPTPAPREPATGWTYDAAEGGWVQPPPHPAGSSAAAAAAAPPAPAAPISAPTTPASAPAPPPPAAEPYASPQDDRPTGPSAYSSPVNAADTP
jgi:hypothetical protein